MDMLDPEYRRRIFRAIDDAKRAIGAHDREKAVRAINRGIRCALKIRDYDVVRAFERALEHIDDEDRWTVRSDLSCVRACVTTRS